MKYNIKYFVFVCNLTLLKFRRYKAAGGKKIPLPLEVRWNSITDCLRGYLDNWTKLLVVCAEHQDDIDKDIVKLVKDDYLKQSTQDYLNRMKPIAIALDRMQRTNCTIADAVDIWKDLKGALQPHLDNAMMKSVDSRMNANLTADHYTAYLLTPKYQGEHPDENELDKVYEHLVNIDESFVPIAMKYQAKTAPFNSFRFVDGAVNGIHPLSWWKLIPSISSAFSRYITGLPAINSSASIERVFSSFGLVHSRIRNRLGIEKAGKLVFIFRILNTGIISAEADNEEICM